MRIIIIILLIIFLSITSLFSIAVISINKSEAEDITAGNETAAINKVSNVEIPVSRVVTIGDIQKFFTTDPDRIFSESSELPSEDAIIAEESTDSNSAENLTATSTEEEEEEEINNIQDQEIEDTSDEKDEGKEETTEEEEDIEDNTVKFYLDGDMENGIYLGKTTAALESTEASGLYGEDFLNTGFKFTIKNDSSFNLLPGSSHYIYIYFYGSESGWDYIREEINLSGEEVREQKITIFIEKPEEKAITADLQLIKGWAVDLRNKENPGIESIEIYLDGPKDYGKFIGDIQYGIPREDVASYFENQNYLNSGYRYEKSIDLKPGSTHTVFVYAFSSADSSFNYETRDIYMSGTKEEKALINALINTQKFHEDSIIEITGWAIDKNTLEEYLEEKQQTEEKPDEDTDQAAIKKIIFNSNRDGNENIYSINIDGTGLTRLTSSGGNDMYPEVSPDGEKIAYTADIGGVWQIMVMDWDGNNRQQITRNNFRSAYPSWSYDGNYIYFEAYIDGDWELFRIKSDGTGQTRLTFNRSSHDWHPTGHPSGYKIIYESGTTGHENIYVMNHDGSGKTKICGDGPRRRVPDVSPDGTKITYMRYSGRYADIWIMNYNGQNETRLTSNSEEDGHPSFSPDGKYIVYEQRKGSREDLILINLATGEKTNLTGSPHIDKDGSFLYRQ